MHINKKIDILERKNIEINIKSIIRKIYIEYLNIQKEFQANTLNQEITNDDISKRLTIENIFSNLITDLLAQSKKINKFLLPKKPKIAEIILRAAIMSNNKNAIKFIYSHSKEILTYAYIDGKTALQFCCFFKYNDAIEELISSKHYTINHSIKEKDEKSSINTIDEQLDSNIEITYPFKKSYILIIFEKLQQTYPIKIHYKLENEVLINMYNTLSSFKIFPFKIVPPLHLIESNIVSKEILPSLCYAASANNITAVNTILVKLLPSLSQDLRKIKKIIFPDIDNFFNYLSIDIKTTTILKHKLNILALDIKLSNIYYKHIFSILITGIILNPIMTYHILLQRKYYYMSSIDSHNNSSMIYNIMKLVNKVITAIVYKATSSYQPPSYQQSSSLWRNSSNNPYYYMEDIAINYNLKLPYNDERYYYIRLLFVGLFIGTITSNIIFPIFYNKIIKVNTFKKYYCKYINYIIKTIQESIKNKGDNTIITMDNTPQISQNTLRDEQIIQPLDSMITTDCLLDDTLKNIFNLYKEAMSELSALQPNLANQNNYNKLSEIQQKLFILIDKKISSFLQDTIISFIITDNFQTIEIIFRSAIIAHHPNLIKYMYKNIDKIMEFSYIDDKTALQFACFFHLNNSVNTLIEIAGYKIIISKNDLLRTSLHYASLGKNITILKTLLESLYPLSKEINKVSDIIFLRDYYNQNIFNILNISHKKERNLQSQLCQIENHNKMTRLILLNIHLLFPILFSVFFFLKMWFICYKPRHLLEKDLYSNDPTFSFFTAPLTFIIEILALFTIIPPFILKYVFQQNMQKNFLKYIEYILYKIVLYSGDMDNIIINNPNLNAKTQNIKNSNTGFINSTKKFLSQIIPRIKNKVHIDNIDERTQNIDNPENQLSIELYSLDSLDNSNINNATPENIEEPIDNLSISRQSISSVESHNIHHSL